jgi:2-oxoglutarate ferredoxin oxidoreductase subunit alpha
VLGWGSTEGAIRAGVRRARERGAKVACATLRHLNPLPANTGEVLRSFDRVLLPELNSGQLAQVLRGKFLVDIESLSKMQGQPLFAAEIEHAVVQRVGGIAG